MNDKDAADIATALSHPLRLEILREMRKRKDASPKDLSQECNQPLVNVSYHITTLREAGLVEVFETVPRRGAIEHRYALAPTPRTALVGQILDLLDAS